MRKFYLYKISNSKNDKLYFGITCRPELRWNEHKYNSSCCTKLKNAMDKYGRDNFKFEILCIGEEEYILNLESKVIDKYDSIKYGYNLIPGGNRSGILLGEETKSKISNGLDKFYSENKSSNKGRVIISRSDDKPVCAFGFWFPNSRTAIKTLGMNKKTFYRRRAESTLHLEVRPLKAIIRPKRFSKEDFDKRSASQKIAKSGEKNPMFGKRKPSNKL